MQGVRSGWPKAGTQLWERAVASDRVHVEVGRSLHPGAIQSFAQMHREVHNWQSAAEEWTVRALESIGAHPIWGNRMPLPVRAEALEAWTGHPELTWRQVPQADTSDAPAPELAAQAVHGKL